ncbi:lactonase family protein [Longimicrobium sp.]|uniref:lactonase family protein n=1 Tax=Longimicrobium sp. TaxID=2029185 RepID=UPI002C42CC9E|nr:beta-propeller fold lactonase family protein [Longimicrobium sp.]HSU16354.1 beta-propeller fold lactonase family protein [Longimicrobium sp.]
MRMRWIGAAAAALVLGGCDLSTDPLVVDFPAAAVFAMTNQPNNEVVMYIRNVSNSVGTGRAFSTRGAGTGASLGSQGALAVSGDGTWLMAANAASNDVSVFQIHQDTLEFVGKTPSGGTRPVSIASRGALVYVLNAGGGGNVTGFQLTASGLVPLGFSQPLSGAADPQPAQVQFSPDGTLLVVTEKATNRIDVYGVGTNGNLTAPVVNSSTGVTPFGFAFSPITGALFVSNANAPGGVPVVDGSSLTEYSVAPAARTLGVVTGPVATTETAACWVVVTANGRYVYASNTGSNSITGFRVLDTALTLLDPDGKTAVTGAGPTDLSITSDGQALYVLDSGDGTIRGYRIGSTGALTQVATASGLPVNSYGLVAN